jgi:RNA polymerase sigma factor (sigma-70 family)
VNDQTDSQLLRAYAEHRSEPAFAELVRRHVDLVYSAASRMVCDSHLAQDVTQAAFVALAKSATQLTNCAVLSGWLHRTAQNIAAQTVRTDVRRRARELEAVAMNELLSAEPDASWEHIAPHLDAALGELSEPDRDALLLRYFERKSAREMAQTLGISDEAAQKRVNRAVERLREFFAKRGVTVGTSGLVVVITANAVQAAPVGLAVTISTAAVLAGTAVTVTTIATQTTATTMNWLNLKSIAAITAAAIAAGTGTHLWQQREANRLRNENQNLVAQQEQFTTARDTASSAAAATKDELDRLQKDQGELLRLRGEVGTLRRQSKELEKLRAENRELRTALAETARVSQPKETDPDADPLKQGAIAKMNDSKLLALGLFMYASDHQEQFPTDLNLTSNYLTNTEHHLTGTNQFELVIQGSLTNVPNPATTIAVREKEAWFAKGKWFKTYAFADGHCEVHTEADGNFEAWEKQRTLAQPGR